MPTTTTAATTQDARMDQIALNDLIVHDGRVRYVTEAGPDAHQQDTFKVVLNYGLVTYYGAPDMTLRRFGK